LLIEHCSLLIEHPRPPPPQQSGKNFDAIFSGKSLYLIMPWNGCFDAGSRLNIYIMLVSVPNEENAH
jgi:hypothetical protein